MPSRLLSSSTLLLFAFLATPTAPRLRADERDQFKVGVQPDGRIVVPTNQILKPAGKQITFPGRPSILPGSTRAARSSSRTNAT